MSELRGVVYMIEKGSRTGRCGMPQKNRCGQKKTTFTCNTEKWWNS